ncbi:hypothetical protein M413DRAFT_240334 [Hebeloma cylindrosporum]|uniref:Peroxidase n=1 Tax=Hebeloma cylindrosporum TaxID=76867 RepID=A0A0C2YCG6_HEBCY|nr:hypothetical protein M413DRAFT_240334 [Hebeloma cylindrosporum h7]
MPLIGAFSPRVLFFLANSILVFYLSLVSAYKWPSPQYDPLEETLYQGGTTFTSFFNKEECRKRSSPRTFVAAEWIRLAYHDSATHDITYGTGGLDASIFHELDRPENSGAGMINAISDFKFAPNKYVSRADVIAIGTVFSSATCGGPIIPFRGGRKDAQEAGPSAVPAPSQDLATHIEKFRLQGFTQEEMIGLVACGHTFGSVRSSDFPGLVEGDPNDKSGVGLAFFDRSRRFDNAIATEYLDGTTQNPLVVSPNSRLTSDKRIFGSDGNVTMQRSIPRALHFIIIINESNFYSFESREFFMQTCSRLLARMIDNVPNNVALTEVITLLPAKVTEAYITVVRSQLLFKTTLRLAQPQNTTIPNNRSVKMLWCNKRGEFKDCSGAHINMASRPACGSFPSTTVTRRLGVDLLKYEFAAPILASESVGKFWFELDEGDGSTSTVLDNGGGGYLLETDEIIYVPWFSTARENGEDTQSQAFDLTFVAGIRSELSPTSATLNTYTNSEDGVIGPPQTPVLPLTHYPDRLLVEGYEWYQAPVINKISDGFQFSVDLEVMLADGASHKFDFGQTRSIDGEEGLDTLISEVTVGSGGD